MKYGIGGVAFTGNKGAEGMLLALIRHIAEEDPDAQFRVLSYYPDSDRKAGHEQGRITILNGSPKHTVMNFFHSLWCAFCRLLHLPQKFWRSGDFGKIADCDLFLDAAGISFADGRLKFTIFNILTFLPALVSGVKIIKVSQALGPFQNPWNKLLAKLFLPRLRLIVARGETTRQFLEELGLKNVVPFSDSAFSLECTDADREKACTLLPCPRPAVMIGISPSQVVRKLCISNGIDYLKILGEVTAQLRAKGYHCIVFPHSAREGVEKTHNNDLPLVKEFAASLPKEGGNLTVIDRELEAGELRCLIGQLDVLIASRFHAIVSAMATGVPAAVIGWSHKYAEVLAPFRMDDYVQKYSDFSAKKTLSVTEELLSRRAVISEELLKESSRIRETNKEFFQLAVRIAAEK